MKNTKQFDSKNISLFTKAIKEKLNELKEEFGIDISLGNTSYGPTHFSTKINVSLIGSADEFEREYDNYVKAGYFQPNLVGLEFTKNGKIYIFRGIQPRARKNKFLAEQKGKGTLYKFAEEDIIPLLSKKSLVLEA